MRPIIGIAKERSPGEHRVALVPESIKKLTKQGFAVRFERGCGLLSHISDGDYEASGASAATPEELWATADLVVKVRPARIDEAKLARRGQVVVSLVYAGLHESLVRDFAGSGVSLVSLDAVPRTTLAQAMDVLSSQATLVGYRAALLAAEAVPKIFPMLMTAAGTIAPAKVLVIGAGVAGLQAIATARRLGAAVEAFDVRRAAKEQVESLGARFVDTGTEDAETAGGYARELSAEGKAKQAAVLAAHVAKADACITTALIPGRRAPQIVTRAMVEGMRAGSVIIDAAAEMGGNCELTRAGERVDHGGVTVIGAVDLPSALAVHASQMFSRNVTKLIEHLFDKDGSLRLDADDEIVRAVVMAHGGQLKAGLFGKEENR